VVSVEAQSFGAPLTLTCSYSEGEGWKTPRKVARALEKKGEFEVVVAGPKYPRMEELTLSVAPLVPPGGAGPPAPPPAVESSLPSAIIARREAVGNPPVRSPPRGRV
jgi:hypothetical protein